MGWTTQQKLTCVDSFRPGKLPVIRQWRRHIPIIQKIWDENPIVQTDYSKKNFYPLYRRKAAEFLTNQGKSGARSWYIAETIFREILQPRCTVNKILARDNATVQLD